MILYGKKWETLNAEKINKVKLLGKVNLSHIHTLKNQLKSPFKSFTSEIKLETIIDHADPDGPGK